ncbi:MAG: hypothetical protein JWP09_574 [Candidatus Taylorbacteria bacterium]|nr:hypothetical protein [Candidatus Taylorbacteria bacterium]
MDNIDIKVLQQILNQNNDTTVALSGSGSKGNEITYFGPKTKDAVKRFQEKYKDKILAPNGLTVGTGFVGKSTRVVLNSFIQSANTATPGTTQSSNTTSTTATSSMIKTATNSVTNAMKTLGVAIPKYLSTVFTDQSVSDFNTKYATTTQTTDAKNYGSMYGYMYSASTTEILKKANLDPNYFFGDNWKKYPHIFTVTPKSASPGDKVVISGINLNNDTLVLTLDDKKIPFTKTADSTFSFTIPYDMDFGQKAISFKKDDQKFEKNQASVLVVKKNAISPSVSSITGDKDSSSISINDTIIMKGSRFADKNDIVTTFGIIKDVPSISDKEIRFSLADAPYLSGIMKTLRDPKKEAEDKNVLPGSIPVIFYVQNENGRSAPAPSVNITFNAKN